MHAAENMMYSGRNDPQSLPPLKHTTVRDRMALAEIRKILVQQIEEMELTLKSERVAAQL